MRKLHQGGMFVLALALAAPTFIATRFRHESIRALTLRAQPSRLAAFSKTRHLYTEDYLVGGGGGGAGDSAGAAAGWFFERPRM